MGGHGREYRVAVVDDDPQQRQLLRGVLEEGGYTVLEGADGESAVELARSLPVDLMLLDVRMPGIGGLEALRRIREVRPETAVILLTAFIDVRDAVQSIRGGALDYLEKPVDLDELLSAVDVALGGAGTEQTGDLAGDFPLPPRIVAESSAMRVVFREAFRVASTGATVLVHGESGTGKEVIARYIHDCSLRASGRFVAVNCAALPEGLVESELFGHERGAFTGAVQSRAGHFEAAAGGTLFLDEIGEMPLTMQPKLLRILEGQPFRRIGGARDINCDVRLVSATNRSLEEDVCEGRFREDLLYRLNVFSLRIPPLRERRDDILPLADVLLAEQNMKGKRFSSAAQRLLVVYSWPGNVRELRNAVTRSAIVSHGSLILPEDLPESLLAASRSSDAPKLADSAPLPGSMEEIQRQAILAALAQTGGNKTQAARNLGISRRNLIYKLRSYGM